MILNIKRFFNIHNSKNPLATTDRHNSVVSDYLEKKKSSYLEKCN